MSCTTAVMLQDRLNDIERNICDGIDFRQELNEAYALADELQAENAKLRELVCWMYDRMDESCAVQYPYAPAPINYDRLMQARARARDLGVEVER